MPIAGHAVVENGQLRLTGLVGDLQGRRIILKHSLGKTKDADALGRTLAHEVLDSGGREILDEVYGSIG